MAFLSAFMTVSQWSRYCARTARFAIRHRRMTAL
jgi:hypothetical protein